ncbi:39S ribosomal protein L42, mitochondrial isoform X1 [Carcharodon carcharias]|uniref:39S ribosomal protein L42, mitochondrial isoform X1 n=1 Tax=Carcharodon carcharias TaxID=13397 RepID=UPI001B7ED13B|nr:39S ribosomal protein L42, mitochondrial isoform X1 [Carcharodon carcharias]
MALAAGWSLVNPILGRLVTWAGAAAAVRGGDGGCICHKSTYAALPNDYNCKVELAMTSDGQTIVCYHPSVDIPYEHTKPISRPSPVENKEETHDQVLKARLDKEVLRDKQAPTIEELSKMFFTTKHRWYPVGHFGTILVNLCCNPSKTSIFLRYHRRRIKPNPPKDR